MSAIANEEHQSAVIGLGLIGTEWARHLHADGVLKTTWNRTPRESGVPFEVELEKLPRVAKILHVVVSDEQAACSVVERLAPELSPEHLLVQSTTIDPETSRMLRARVVRCGAAYLEAPFSGSLPAAKARQTIFYLGADAALVARATPYLQRLSVRQFHLGTNEQACCFKLAMNLQIVSAVEALAEALTISRSAGIDDRTFFKAFKENASYSGVAALKEPKLTNADYTPQFSVRHMSKDMRLLAKVVGAREFPLLQAARKVLVRGEEHGLSDQDFSAIITLLE